MISNISIRYRWLAVLLVFPNLISELLTMNIDIANFSGNAKLIQKIISYHSTEIKTLFDHTIQISWIGSVGALFYIVLHAVVAVMLLVGFIQMIKYRKVDSKDYHQHLFWAVAGLVSIVFYYFFFFAVLAMTYFLSMEQGVNFSMQIICFCVPAAVALFYLMFIR